MIGRSLYLQANLGKIMPQIPEFGERGTPVFISLHILEEVTEEYAKNMKTWCQDLIRKGYRLIADISPKTLDYFQEEDICHLARQLGLWALRIDYGFALETIERMGQEFSIVVNASTIPLEEAQEIQKKIKNPLVAMHNFYPREDTGLDEDFLRERNQAFHKLEIPVWAFVAGDKILRGPVYSGLPTLERHRFQITSASYIELMMDFGVDQVFIGDPGLSRLEEVIIKNYLEEEIIALPVVLDESYQELYNKIFTRRFDSPKGLIRVQESRHYANLGSKVSPQNCGIREVGSITIDNENYGRYSGEIQILSQAKKADPRVNLIGKVSPKHLMLLQCIGRGKRFKFIGQRKERYAIV